MHETAYPDTNVLFVRAQITGQTDFAVANLRRVEKVGIRPARVRDPLVEISILKV